MLYNYMLYTLYFLIYFHYHFDHRQNSQSRENISSPEDEVVGGSEADRGEGETSQGAILELIQKKNFLKGPLIRGIGNIDGNIYIQNKPSLLLPQPIHSLESSVVVHYLKKKSILENLFK